MTPELTNHRIHPAAGKNGGIEVALAGGEVAARETLHKVLNEVNELPLVVSEVAVPPLSQNQEAIKAQLLMVLLGPDSEKWAQEIHSWFDGTVRPVVIGLTPIRTSEAVRMALRAGAEEVIFLPADRDELARCLIKISETRKDICNSHRSLTCSLVSVAGGAGVSTLTAGLAFAIRRLTQKQVGLLDLGLQCSALSAVLDVEPALTISELVDRGSDIDSIRLESALTRHDSGLCLLAAPARIEEAELVSPDTVGSVARAVRLHHGRLRASSDRGHGRGLAAFGFCAVRD
jgi:pilus assembly protein CpaE